MRALGRFGRYAGGTVALTGLAFAAAFVGPRTADPLASTFFGPLGIWTQLLGVVGGLLVLAAGLRVVGLSGRVLRADAE